MDRIKAFINGRFQNSDGEILIKINPVSGAPIAEVEKTNTALLEQAITAAKNAQIEWSSFTGQERGHIMMRAARMLASSLEELTRLEVRDVGKAWSEAISADVPCGAEAYEYFGSLAATLT
ncbi:MAG: aldehyde dehydrogenase family protein, partial [Alphaproteobacteria bacterium]